MKFLVLSNRHALLPLAHRLRSEGHEVRLLMRKRRFERAWGAMAQPLLRHSKDEFSYAQVEPLAAAVKAGEYTLISDVPSSSSFSRLFADCGGYLKLDVGSGGRGGSGSSGEEAGGEAGAASEAAAASATPGSSASGAVRVGWWFDGEFLRSPHLLVYDLGAWPFGLGPQVPGGLTLITPTASAELGFLDEPSEPLAKRLKQRGFRGLVNAVVDRDPRSGGVGLYGVEAGWPDLHTAAWLSSTEHVGEVLGGSRTDGPTSRYTVVLPVSIPPWPSLRGEAEVQGLEDLHPSLQGKFFWYDITPDPETRALRTAGLDGLVAVARGEGGTFERARRTALALTQALPLHEKQYRPDVGSKVPEVLGLLEQTYGVVL